MHLELRFRVWPPQQPLKPFFKNTLTKKLTQQFIQNLSFLIRVFAHWGNFSNWGFEVHKKTLIYNLWHNNRS